MSYMLEKKPNNINIICNGKFFVFPNRQPIIDKALFKGEDLKFGFNLQI